MTTKQIRSAEAAVEISVNPMTSSLFSAVTDQTITAGLFTFLPLLYVTWSDAVLTPAQVTTLCTQIEAQAWLTQREKRQLYAWLDPANPPAATQLKSWLATIQQAADELPRGIAQDEKQSLAALGQTVARVGDPQGYARCTTLEASTALHAMEATLGIISHEAYHKLFHEDEVAPAAKPMPSQPSFDPTAMTHLLDGDQVIIRQHVRTLLAEPRFAYVSTPDKDRYRDHVLGWCNMLAEQGLGAIAFPQPYGGQEDMAQYLAIMETLSYHDLSLVIKFGVQFGLFGGSIHLLGTEAHHQQYLSAVGNLTLPGSFAMTELGHGSNVRDIETTAHYDPTTEEFVIHTPTESARKEYIGNAARHGQLSTVFAQLTINGERYGVHAFLVPIRKPEGETMPGVRIEDNGEKMGLNGVDNGRIWFDQVRVPRTALLNRFADVTPEGEYQSPIAGEARRFFTMIGTLVAGRIGIATSAVSAAKSGLTIAIRYAAQRRQFGNPGQPETILLDYQTHQRRLMPLLANAYALDFALKYLVRRFVNRTEEDMREVETLAAGLKAFSTWNTTRTIQTGREACGGQGYLAENRFAALKADTDIFTTFEGDNTVLMQLVAKSCLAEFKQQFSDMKLLGLVRYITGQASQTVAVYNPLLTRNTDQAHLHDSEFHLTAFRYREQRLVTSLARRLRTRLEQGMDSHEAMIECQDHLVNLAQAYVERVILEQFVDGIAQVDDPALVTVLKKLCDLYALWHLEQHKGWYLETGYFEGNKTKAIRRQIDTLCYEVSREAVPLVDAFAIPEQCLAAPIALKA